MRLGREVILTLSTTSYVPPKSIDGEVTITGIPQIGKTLTADASGITASDEATSLTFTYQWYRGDAVIDGAINQTYIPVAADADKTIKVVVSATGYTGSVTSDPTAAVEKMDAPTAPDTSAFSATTITDTSITLTENATWEYRLGDDGNWQKSNQFTGLTAETEYKIYARVAETEDTKASAASAPLTVITKAAPISEVTVTVDAPEKNATPAIKEQVDVTPSDKVTVSSVEWLVNGEAFDETQFAGSTAYTVKITLTASDDPGFAGTVAVTLNGGNEGTVSPTGNTLVITKTFDPTAARTVESIDVSGSYKTEYVEGENFDRTGMEVTATYDDDSTSEVTDYTVFPETLTADTTKVTISYSGVETTVNVTVLKELSSENFTFTKPTDLTYDGSAKTATVTAEDVTGIGTVTVWYEGANGTSYEKSQTAPINAGTYQVTFDVAKSDSYAAATGLVAGTFTIEKATTAISVNDLTVKIGQQASLNATIDPSGLTLSYESDDDSIATVNENGEVTGETAGNTTITVSYAGDGNHNSDSKTVTVTVTEKDVIAVTFTAKTPSKSYIEGGYALGDQFTAATVANGETITGYKYGDQEYTTLEALNDVTVTNVGTYTVTAYYESDTEYGETSATFEITKATQIPLTIDSANSVTFGQPLELSTTGGSGTGAVTYTVQDGNGSATIGGSTLTPTKAGTVTVTATKAADSNYEATSAQLVITINKAEATADMKSATGTIMANQSGSVTLNLPEGAIATVKDSSASPEVTNPVVSGSTLTYTGSDGVQDGTKYTVTISVTSTNYNDYEIVVTLTGTDKVTPTGRPTLSTTTLTYGQSLSEITLSGSMAGTSEVVAGTFTWNAPGTVPNAGTYTAAWTFTPTDTTRYTEATGTVTITVNKATPTGAPKYTAISTSGKTLKDAGLTTEGGTFSVPGTVAWELDETTAVQANTYYKWIFTPDSSNYEQLTDTIQLWHRSSSGGGSSSGGSSSGGNKTETDTNPDGSTTTVTSSNGTVTETTKYPDGSKEVVETKTDGTVTTTVTDRAGNETETVENPDGSSRTTVDNADGSGSVTTVSEDGQVSASVNLPLKVIEDAAEQGEAVSLPMPSVPNAYSRADAATVTVDLPAGRSARVEIPVSRVTSGTVAILVGADGTETVLRTSLTTPDGVTATLRDGDTVKIVDNSKTFSDVSSSYWAVDAIDFTTSRELFAGNTATTFNPAGTTNRQQVWMVLARLEGNSPANMSAAKTWAVDNGISDGSNPTGTMTRQQLAAMLYRYAQSMGLGFTGQWSYQLDFTDVGSVSSYAYEAMCWMNMNGIIGGMGDGTLNPQGSATRAQVAAILQRFVTVVNG